jgi:hypothetical protein
MMPEMKQKIDAVLDRVKEPLTGLPINTMLKSLIGLIQ